MIICALISDLKAQNTFRAHQNLQQIPGWQNRNYQAKQKYTTKKSYYEPPAANLKPPFIPEQVARLNVPLITESPFKSQPNYGYKPQALSPSSKATILKQEYERLPDGGYRFL